MSSLRNSVSSLLMVLPAIHKFLHYLQITLRPHFSPKEPFSQIFSKAVLRSNFLQWSPSDKLPHILHREVHFRGYPLVIGKCQVLVIDQVNDGSDKTEAGCKQV